MNMHVVKNLEYSKIINLYEINPYTHNNKTSEKI